ncbi:MAG TPA: DNA-formamidopyrimidine glycosylase family protein [Blastocatellia bacterium]|nr:DNA-formamidopyrimidine glycosylase family protein [Blastocatellia bacterium]
MAEVPEVEILAQGLREVVCGRRIDEVVVLQPDAVRFPAVPEFIALLQGRTVRHAQRRAKYLLLTLSDDFLLAVHLALWGTLQLVPTTNQLAAETLIRWQLNGDEDLRLVDKLGYARAAAGPTATLTDVLDLASLGPEALAPSFDVGTLAQCLAKRRGVLKSVLLNQRVLAGLGNRDADESMWLARIDPRRSAASLSDAELTRLHAAIIEVLHQGLALRGTQRDLLGKKGAALHGRFIFEKTGHHCPRCGTRIAHLRLGGRNTHFCPQCQM